ncbi:AUGMIN subunit 2-like [Xenia sp. Carnegie-2017]|uniref:AUGMIN subunit 2-like n=1 Tax=Xenia sp. Carnegie-2017 TaxID=2897299 RepID=UPI001F03CCAD|nr:AUGMIN subunit 2-like [Xenia sp. Carnegie-2017]
MIRNISGTIAPVNYSESLKDSKNPWSTFSPYIDVGSLEKVLTLARKKGQLPQELGEDRYNEIKKRVRETSKSVQLIEQLENLSSLQTSLSKVKEKICEHHLEQETKDLTDPNSLDEKIKKLEDLARHFSANVDKKEELVNRLQQPFVGDYINIDAEYQKYLVDAISQLSDILTNVTTYVDNLTWNCTFTWEDSTLEKILGGMSSTLAQMQSFFQASFQQRNLMSKRLGETRKLHD